MRRPRASLGVKILGVISLVTCVVFFALFAANYSWKQEITIRQIDRMGLRVSELLSMAIDGPMRRGDNPGTHEQFRLVAELYEDIRIHLTDFRGNITYSTEPDVLRRDLVDIYENPEIQEMLELGLREKTDTGTLLDLQGRPYYLRVRSIINGPECHHCHGASQPTLGALLEFQDMHEDFAQLRTMQMYGGLMALGGLAVLLTCVLFYLRIRLLDRISKLSRISQAIRQGNYTEDFTIRGRDEISELGQNLSAMVQRLQSAEKYAAIGEFSTYIAHEIRNPLFAIGGFANTLVRSPNMDATSQQKVQIILSESKRLDDILRIFINFSRPLELTMSSVRIDALVRETLPSLQTWLQSMQIDMRMEPFEPLPALETDPEMVQQCLKNLIKNSVSTMPEGGSLRISLQEDADSILLTVADNGHGLPDDVLEHPFNPFTSLELAMTRKIMIDLGGELQLESSADSGTSATMRLPKVQGIEAKR